MHTHAADRRHSSAMHVDRSRRAALAALGAAAAGAALAGCASKGADMPATAASPAPVPPQKFFDRRISLAQWSLHRALKAGEIANIDFPTVARERYELSAVEWVSTFFGGRVLDEQYLAELRFSADRSGVRSVLIMVDGEGDLGAADAAARKDAVERHTRWLHAANVLGCFAIRVNARSEGTPDEQRARSAEGIGMLADRALAQGLDVIVENHGGISSNGSWMAALMKQIGRPNVGTLPDFGNFKITPTEQYDRYAGIAEMMPWARDVSAKSYGFDAAGNETTIDYDRVFGILDAAGYNGYVGIEFEGKGMPEHEGILATKRLLERRGVRA
jgi:sugar phosphate isomerase/epimerase